MTSNGDALRLFLALWPGPAARTALAVASARWRWPPRAAAVPIERLHLTLHYIGAWPRARLAEATRALEVRFEPFTLVFGRDELWSHGIAALVPEHAPPRLLALHGALGNALRELGIEPEARPFRPHVTLARRAGGAAPPSPLDARWRWPVRGYALVESASRPGSTYRVLQRYR